MSRQSYTDPQDGSLAIGPTVLKITISGGDMDRIYAIPGFREFVNGCDPMPQAHDDLIVAFYAYVISDNFACLKTSFLINMMAAARGLPKGYLLDELLGLTIPAIACLIDVYSSTAEGINVVNGYKNLGVLPLDVIASEFVDTFRLALEDIDVADMFDDNIDENDTLYECHTEEVETLAKIKAGVETYLRWASVMDKSLAGMSDEERMRAYASVVEKCANDNAYNAIVLECTRRKVALLKCNKRLREFAELVQKRIGGDAPAKSSRPCTTPARVQSSVAKNQRARWTRPSVISSLRLEITGSDHSGIP